MPNHEFINVLKTRKGELEGELSAINKVIEYYEDAPNAGGGGQDSVTDKGKNSTSKARAEKKPKTDLTGKKFGKLTAISYAGNRYGMPSWNCKCECGTEKKIQQSYLENGAAVHCGRDVHVAA